jgi:hypothetical protein
MKSDHPDSLQAFLSGKPAETVSLFNYFVDQFSKIGNIQAIPAKTMIGIATPRKRIAYVTRIGRDFVHIVFHFNKPYHENLCFEKIAQVPGTNQYNHHLRIKRKQDINSEVLRFMKLAYEQGV